MPITHTTITVAGLVTTYTHRYGPRAEQYYECVVIGTDPEPRERAARLLRIAQEQTHAANVYRTPCKAHELAYCDACADRTLRQLARARLCDAHGVKRCAECSGAE